MTGPRSLADDLRSRDDAALALLLQRRPDLAHPLPADVGQLAARSVTQAATARAIDRLNEFELQLLDVLVVLPDPVTTDDVHRAATSASLDDVRLGVDDLVLQGLVWGSPAGWRATATVKEALGRYPAGLGPPLDDLPAAQPLDELIDALRDLPDDVAPVLERLTWGPPNGRVENADRPVSRAFASTPIEWLLAHGLLVAADKTTVVLPREIGLHLRQGQVHRGLRPAPPPLTVVDRDQERVDRSAAGSAFEFVRRVEDLLEAWSIDPPGVLRSGGLGVRDLRSAALLLDLDEPATALVVEVAFAAGLLATSGEVDDAWLPTPAYDGWRTQDTAHRWLELAHAWLDTTRAIGLIGSKGVKDSRINALSPELDRVVLPDIRHAVLHDLAGLPPGHGGVVGSLVDRQAWRRPRRGGRLRDDFARWALAEASTLGLTALDAASTCTRALLDDDIEAAAAALADHLPSPVDHVLLQADLTAVAPGPLAGEVARELSLMADLESSGGASVYRFSDRSIRRALDAGRSSIDLLQFLERRSRTAVPQPLTYLVQDVARRHGRVRVGAAGAYVRSDDPAVLDEIAADPRSDVLRGRRIAPTVIITQAAPEVVLDRLRQLNLAPAAETSDGSVVVNRPDSLRTGPRQRPPRLLADPPVPATAVAEAAVRALRSGERGKGRTGSVAGPAAGSELPPTAVADTIEVLQNAIARSCSVWLGYVGTDGVAAERVVDPVAVRGGWLTAFDHRVEQVRTFAVHRITGVAVLDARQAPSE